MYMKMKMTRNQIADLPVDKIVTAGCCDLQHLLSGVDPIGYNAGVRGWNYDVYVIDGICILTGYRTPSKYPKVVKAEMYESRAQKIRMDYRFEAEMFDCIAKERKAFIAEQLHADA